MADVLLTIAIPTFNRPRLLAATVATIVPQLQDGVRLLIIDNQSDEPVSEVLAGLCAGDPRVEIVRNRVNIGGNANICRCFESCESDWLWILGDDDGIQPGSVARVLELARGCDRRDLYLNFSNPGLPSDRICCTTPDAMFTNGTGLGNLICLPMCLFHMAVLRTNLRYAYQWLSTCAPQLVLVLKTWDDRPDSRVWLLREGFRIPEAEIPFRGSGLVIAWCTATLPHLPLQAVRSRHLRRLVPSMVTPQELVYETLVEVRRGRLTLAQAVGQWRSIARIKYGAFRRPFEWLRLAVGLLRHLIVGRLRRLGLLRGDRPDERQTEDRT